MTLRYVRVTQQQTTGSDGLSRKMRKHWRVKPRARSCTSVRHDLTVSVTMFAGCHPKTLSIFISTLTTACSMGPVKSVA